MKRILQVMVLFCSAGLVWAEDNPLKLAVLNHDLGKVGQLLDLGAAVDVPDQDQKTALMLAVEKGYADIAALLLQRGANPKLKDASGNTLFHFAAQAGNLELMNQLKALNRPFDEPNKNKETPYLVAVAMDKVAAVRLLASWGGQPKGKMRPKDSLLHYAAKQGAASVIEYLCEQGMAVDVRADNGHTPLMTAVLSIQAHAVSVLLRLGADPLARDDAGQSAQSYARYVRNRETYQLLRNHGCQGAELFEAVCAGDVATVKALLAKGLALETTNPDGETPLFVAATEGQAEVLQALIALGADSGHVSGNKWTPLYAAAFRGNLSCVELLLAQGVNPNQPVPGGDTALGAALSRGHVEVAAALTAKGASILYYFPGTNQARQIKNASLGELKQLRQKALVEGEFEPADVPFWINQHLDPAPIDCTQTGPEFVAHKIQPVQPRYPETALKIRLKGYLVLSVVLGRDGSISDIKILRPLGNWTFGFEVAAMEAVGRYAFVPGTYHGRPADVRTTLKLDFMLL